MRRSDLTRYRWYVRANDLVGGFCVMATDAPPSQSYMVVADMCGKPEAIRIVTLHNENLRASKRTKIVKTVLLVACLPISLTATTHWVSDTVRAGLWALLFFAAIALL